MFSRKDFLRAIQDGVMDLGLHPDIQAASVNMGLEEVWVQRPRSAPVALADASDAEPLEDFLAEHYRPSAPDPITGSWIFPRGMHFIAFLRNEVRIPPLFFGGVYSRSSYARMGLGIRLVDDDLQGGKGFHGRIPVTISVLANTLVGAEESPAQLTIDSTASEGTGCSTPLTLAERILVYDGKTFLSKKHPETIGKAFRAVTLPEEGSPFSSLDTFFLASTRESVIIPLDRVGYLPESLGRPGEVYPPFRLHTAAPLIMPGDTLTITLECQMKFPSLLKQKMPLPALTYRLLESPLDENNNSRYHGQNGVTLSR